jgi:hypothetical protein
LLSYAAAAAAAGAGAVGSGLDLGDSRQLVQGEGASEGAGRPAPGGHGQPADMPQPIMPFITTQNTI